MKVYDSGCPICGDDNTDMTLMAQMGHMYEHSWHERWRLYRQTHQHLNDLLIFRKYSRPRFRVAVEPPPVGSGGPAPSRPPG